MRAIYRRVDARRIGVEVGANTLEITNDSAENTGVRHLRVKIDKKGSKFASLIDRLSGKK